ncbi:uncharacterized protein BO97DRAFT_12314 [Aspergillus homomorphus CBS 101889]|uniref:Uncharacterized protein n=1 Tax=Aspergillus homomorphus (strain CBS 101889) TaxID=1450537 RepID=A0A395ICC8_ASPHC|nr:hypothetical protein BO97DRAFT_12314 [Aspergillus homomorphus CBS 101889]RAL17691.1 hypothetical protein BO97DRAFT_12314 [Aspergillus homomorphus CBS 101889]
MTCQRQSCYRYGRNSLISSTRGSANDTSECPANCGSLAETDYSALQERPSESQGRGAVGFQSWYCVMISMIHSQGGNRSADYRDALAALVRRRLLFTQENCVEVFPQHAGMKPGESPENLRIEVHITERLTYQDCHTRHNSGQCERNQHRSCPSTSNEQEILIS